MPRYFYSGPTFAVTESDGIRLVGPDSCDFVQKVPGKSCGRKRLSRSTNVTGSIVGFGVPARFHLAVCNSVRCLGEFYSPFAQSRREHPKYPPRTRCCGERVYRCCRTGMGACLATPTAQCEMFLCSRLLQSADRCGVNTGGEIRTSISRFV